MGEGKEWFTPYIEPDFSMGCTLEYEYIRRPPFPLLLYMNLHNRCTAMCDLCPRSKQADPPAYMDWDLYAKTVDEFSEKGGEVIVLSPHAEPFADKKVIEYIRYAALKGLKFYFITDMAGLDEETLNAMINFGLSARFEILFPGIFEETWRKSTGVCLWESLQNIKNLKRKYGNIGFIRAVKEHFLPFEQDVAAFYWNFLGIGVVFEETLDCANMIASENKPMRRIGMGCVPLLNGLTVDADGTALLCPMDADRRQPLGNLRTDTIENIWNYHELKSITDEVYKEKRTEMELICNHCRRLCL